MKTCKVTPANIEKKWVTVDATGQTLGRLASQVASVLRGKHKPNFVRHLDCGDNVIITNAEKVVLTGRKLDQKVYYHHTGYVGGIKSILARDLLEKHPTRILEGAINGMLPKNKMRKHLMRNLRVVVGADHEHAAQKPEAMAQRLVALG